MNEPVESVLQKSREEFEKAYPHQPYAGANVEASKAIHFLHLKKEWDGWQKGWQASRSALEPMLAELHARVENAEETTRTFKESNIKLYADSPTPAPKNCDCTPVQFANELRHRANCTSRAATTGKGEQG